LNEIPDWNYEGAEVIERIQEAPLKELTSMHKAAIELVVPIGGRHYYGGIAVAFTPQEKKELVVQVPLSADDGIPYKESLVDKMDIPFIGFPREYVSGIFEGVMNAGEIAALGGGTLRVSGAVHGRVGSSIWMFSVLSRIVVKLLTLDLSASIPSETELIELVQNRIR
jgi:hypothetical protein